MKNYYIGKTGNINDIDGLEIYIHNEQKIASIKLYNFEYIDVLHNEVYSILPDDINFNYNNCLVFFNLYVNEKYRKNGYGTKVINLALEECKKLNIEYFLGHRNYGNEESDMFWNKINFTKLINNENIEVFYKKL